MTDNISSLDPDIRKGDFFHHIDMGFLNRRLCLSFLGAEGREYFRERKSTGEDHFSQLSNDHLLVTMVIDLCDAINVPTLQSAIALGRPKHMFRSTERLAPCPEVYSATRVTQEVRKEIDLGKRILIKYHTEHLISSTGKMMLAGGNDEGYQESIIGLVHDGNDCFEIEPMVMGNPWFDHPRNKEVSNTLMWFGHDFGEILPEDIDQFAAMKDVTIESAKEWMDVMKAIKEQRVKEAFAALLGEPSKKDWGGEKNDHFSANVSLAGRRKTAAFMFKGPARFSELTLDMCGKRADQIQRLAGSGADISIVQHAHMIGETVRQTVRQFTVYPGGGSRKYCMIDGPSTYRILKAYSKI